MLSTTAQEGIEAYEEKYGAWSVQDKLSQYDTTGAKIETPTIDTPDIPEVTQPEDVSGTKLVQDTEVTPVETMDTTTTPTGTQTEWVVTEGNAQVQQAEDLKNQEIEKLKEERDKTIEDTKKGYALGKAKFEENKEYYTNFDELNNKYEAVIADITSSMSDTGVIDESKYQEIANKYGLTIEEVKNPNRIFDKAELTDEGKDKLGVTNFENSITESTKNFERTIEDLNQNISRTQESYNQQMEDAYRTVQDTISGARAWAAASGLYRSTAMESTVSRTRQDWERVIQRLRNGMNRSVWDIQTSISRITEDFNTSITDARKDFEDNYKQVNTENLLALSEASLNYTGDKLKEALDQISEEFGVKSQQVFSQYMNNINAINSAVNNNMDLADRIADKAEEQELKTYNEYLANDGLLLQSARLTDLVQWVQEGTISVDSAQKLKNIMQTSIQATLGAITALDINDIDQINYLLEQGYTPEETIALMQQTYDKFQPKEEVQKPFTVWAESYVYDPETKSFMSPVSTWTQITRDSAKSLYWSTPAVRNFNPWNIMDTWFWGRRVEWERFTVFDTPQEWFSALIAKIQNIQNGNSQVYSPNMTITEYIWKYAPASDNNNVSAYANSVAKYLWVDVNTTIWDLDPVKLASAHAKHEDSNSYRMLLDLWIINEDWSLWTQEQAQWPVEFKSDAWPIYEDFLKTWDYGSDANRKSIEAEFWSLENFRKQAEAYNYRDWWPADKELQNIKELRDQLKSFISDDNKRALDNSIGNVRVTLRPKTAQEKQDFMNAINFFTSGQTLQALIDAKWAWATFGALSNEELKMLQNSASNLASIIRRDDETQEVYRLTGSKDKFIESINTIIEDYDEQIKKSEDKITKIRWNMVELQEAQQETQTSFTAGNWTTYSIKIK